MVFVVGKIALGQAFLQVQQLFLTIYYSARAPDLYIVRGWYKAPLRRESGLTALCHWYNMP
jgi:hypothetical protein